MPIISSKRVLFIASTFLVISWQQLQASSGVTRVSEPSSPKHWLDKAVREKQCPSTPVNVRASFERSGPLLERITISGGKLYIEGTENPDHIVISADIPPGFVNVQWDGEQ